MSRATSAMRLEEGLPEQEGAAPPANTSSAPSFSNNRLLLAALARLSSEEIYALEDELDFYAFTGMAGPGLKPLLGLLNTRFPSS